MSVCVNLHLRNKKVVLVGGGNVAYRKCKQFLESGANVYVVAFTICEEIKKSKAICFEEELSLTFLNDAFLVYAATNDETYNHEIVMYCKKNGILCGSAVRDENVSVSSMMQSVQENFTIALDTHGLAPALGKKIVQEAVDDIKNKYIKIFTLLSIISNGVNEETYKALRPVISFYPESKLVSIAHMLEKKKVRIEILHGSKDAVLLEKELPRFIQHIQTEDDHIEACFSSLPIYEKCKEEYPHLFSLDEILFLAKHLKEIQFCFDLLFVNKGTWYQNVYHQCRVYGEILPFWISASKWKIWIQELVKKHSTKLCIFVMHEKNPEFQSLCRQYGAEAVWMKETMYSFTKKELCVIPLFIGRGYHFKKDIVQGKDSFVKRLLEQGYTIEIEPFSLLDRQVKDEVK